MKRLYEYPELELIDLSESDVVTDSDLIIGDEGTGEEGGEL